MAATISMKLPSLPLRSRDGSVAGLSLLVALVGYLTLRDSNLSTYRYLGLFSDGFCQAVIGPVNTMLGIIYPDSYTKSSAQQNVSSIAFAGTVLGQLVFGYTSDHWSRSNSLLISTIIIIVFAALGAGSYGAGGSVQGLFAALTAYRFLLGIGM